MTHVGAGVKMGQISRLENVGHFVRRRALREPIDSIKPLRDQVRERFDALLLMSDRSTLEMLAEANITSV